MTGTPSSCAASRPESAYAPTSVVAAALLLPVVVASYVLRLTAVATLRSHHPEAARFVERYWSWLPMAVVIGSLTLSSWPLGALAAGLATVIVARPEWFGLPRDRPGPPEPT